MFCKFDASLFHLCTFSVGCFCCLVPVVLILTLFLFLIRVRDGIQWVSVSLPCTKEWDDTFDAYDLEGLMIAWGQMIKSGRQINFQSILELASNFNVTCGKWMFFTATGAKIDFLWQKIATSVINGNSPVFHSAKVSTFHEDGDGRHVVCIYNPDFRNRQQVLQLEHAIRNTGIKCMLTYKPDVYTYLGVYKKNPWGLRPTIMKSMFDIKTGNSIITSDVLEI